MSSSSAVRWGGLAAMVAGALFVADALFPFVDEALPSGPPLSVEYLSTAPIVLASLLLLGGLVGLRALHADSYGRSVKAGFWLTSAATLLLPLLSLDLEVFSLDRSIFLVLVIASAFTLPALLSGELLLGIATLRAGMLPLPWRALPLSSSRSTF